QFRFILDSKLSTVITIKLNKLHILQTYTKYPQPKGQKKKKIVKYGMGGLIVFFLICIIWFPLLFISLVRSVVGVVNHPVDVTVTVKLGGYEPLFTMSVQQQSIQPFTEADYNHLTELFGSNAVAMQFITLYSYEDIVTANIEGSSGSVWRISPPSRQEVIKELLGSPADMTLRLAWNFQRDLNKGGTVENTFDKHSINLEPGNPVRADLASLLVGNRTDRVPHMFPNYIRAPNGAEAKPVSQLYEEGYQNVTLSLMRDGSLNGSGAQEWWDISVADCDQSSGACGVLPMIIFNDKDHGAVRIRDFSLHHVRGASLRRPHPQTLHGHLPGAGDGRAGAGGGALLQTHLPLPISRDHDQMDPGEEQRLDSSRFHLNYLSFSVPTHLVQVGRPRSKCLRLDRGLPHGLLGRVEC
uniref:Piezo type mechanosensitive ion channel component 1 (Er blood group) n=1 Tax=Astyanax mexicanus TaxID=7994 RepID=A0A3B1KH08_ASTMX